ncbi:MAG: D-glycero-beta-D-manno-heptose 1-phosphate adenylyltransferase [Gemmatimonadaceae bacterium]
MSRSYLARKVRTPRDAREWRSTVSGKLVFTNGVFDLIHPGHIDVLVAARECGDALVVGLNSDASVRRLKGPARPVRNEVERAYVLSALEMVDCVVLFDEDTPIDLVVLLEPDVIVKGGDYTVGTIVGAREVQARGGEAIVIPLTPGQSTTLIIEKLSGR